MSTTSSQPIATPMPSAVTPRAKPKGMMQVIWEQFIEHKLAVVSLFVIISFVLMAIGADLIAYLLGLDPNAQSILNRYGEWSSSNWLGTDEAGRDVFIRLIYGARISLGVAFAATISSAIIGITVGSLAGYYGGYLDSILMRITDSLLALPVLPILIILASIDFGKLPIIGFFLGGEDSSIVKMILIMMFFSWMVQARLVRGEILSLKEREFILAAKVSGQSDFAIIIKEILPNVLSPVTVAVTLQVGSVILYEATLSFLGLGIQPPSPSWGNMLFNAQEIIYSAPMLAVMPGLLILIIVMSFNFLGDGLQAALDPKAIRR